MSAPKGYVSSLSPWQRLVVNRNWIAFWFMLPAAGFLIMFLAYPLGLGVWMSFTDVRIGRPGEGAAIATAMIPFLLAAITISWFGMQRRKWQQGSEND